MKQRTKRKKVANDNYSFVALMDKLPSLMIFPSSVNPVYYAPYKSIDFQIKQFINK